MTFIDLDSADGDIFPVANAPNCPAKLEKKQKYVETGGMKDVS
jgi:hypothetical protein